MVDVETLFSISYGLYIVTSGNKDIGNGYISNTVFQVTSEPPRFATCCNKNNYTSEIMKDSGNFAVAILHTGTSSEIFSRFGYTSGKDMDKFNGLTIKHGKTGVPIVINDIIAFLECKITSTFDVGTHLLFIGDLVQTEMIDSTKEPMTYRYYRQVKKGRSPKNAPTYVQESQEEKNALPGLSKKYKCCICGYIYDDSTEAIKFDDLPNEWVCPLCGATKKEFIEV